MKKILIKATMLLAMICSTNTADAQINNILNYAAPNNYSDILSTIGGLITNKLVPSSKQIVGTWAYQEPAVMFTSSNALKSTASALVSKQIEKKLQTYLTKVGIKKNNMTITFKDDKTFYVAKAGKKVSAGTYTLANNEVTLKFNARKNPCKLTPQLNNGTLVVVMDATKIKTFFEGIGSNVSQLATVTSLMKSMDGMKVGIRLSKK